MMDCKKSALLAAQTLLVIVSMQGEGDPPDRAALTVGRQLGVPDGLSEDYRVIVLRITRCVQERQRSFRGTKPERREFPLGILQFYEVTPAKFRPAARIVAEPFSQGGARSQIAGPKIQMCELLLEPPGPQAIH
jgi:hypothetical protein